jgi:hypothetical protein
VPTPSLPTKCYFLVRRCKLRTARSRSGRSANPSISSSGAPGAPRVDYTQHGGQAATADIPLGWWIAGDVVSSSDMPTTGSASYMGDAIGNVINSGKQYTATGDMSMIDVLWPHGCSRKARGQRVFRRSCGKRPFGGCRQWRVCRLARAWDHASGRDRQFRRCQFDLAFSAVQRSRMATKP